VVCGSTWHSRRRRLLAATQKSNRPFTHCVILAGTNDLCAAASGETIADALRILHATARKHGCVTLGVTIPEHGWEQRKGCSSITETRLAANAALGTMVEPGRLVELAEALPQFGVSAEIRKMYWDDHLHFTFAGYERLSALVLEALRGEGGW
jgi:lysophospholipase L1-like esterase